MAWTESELQLLKEFYPKFGKVKTMEFLNKTEGQIRSKASELKLKQDRNSEFFKDWQKKAANSKIGKKRPEHSIRIKELIKNGVYENFINISEERRKEISIRTKKWMSEKGHPKGFKGHYHSEETKIKQSEASKNMWKNEKSKVNTKEHRQYLSDKMSMNQSKGLCNNSYSRTINGNVDVNGRIIFFRSSWECDIAFYFEFLKANDKIKEWEYEPTVFWFEKIKRGVRSYKPDFRITKKDGSQYYVEVKGWMDDKSKTKLNRMRIYYPEIEIELINSKRYKDISKISGFINVWGSMKNGAIIPFEKCGLEGCNNKIFKNEKCRKHYK